MNYFPCSQQFSIQEIWRWVHRCYGDELGLTSDDEDYIPPGEEKLAAARLSLDSLDVSFWLCIYYVNAKVLLMWDYSYFKNSSSQLYTFIWVVFDFVFWAKKCNLNLLSIPGVLCCKWNSNGSVGWYTRRNGTREYFIDPISCFISQQQLIRKAISRSWNGINRASNRYEWYNGIWCRESCWYDIPCLHGKIPSDICVH